MFKNMKLGTKIVGGFAIVLVLTAAVAYLGYKGLTGTVARVEQGEDANRIVKDIQDCRQAEKDFIIRGDEEYVTKNKAIVQSIYEQIAETKLKLRDLKDIGDLEKVHAQVQAYEKAFTQLTQLYEQQKIADAAMVENARAFIVECEHMRADQKQKLAAEIADRKNTAGMLADRLWKVDAGNRLIKCVLDMRRHEKNFVIRGEEKDVEKIDEELAATYALCDELNVRFKEQVNKNQVAKVRSSAEKYREAFHDWERLYHERLKSEEAMVAAARAAAESCERLRAGQKERMDAGIAQATSMMMVSALLAIVLGSLLAFVITHGITKPVNRIIADLTERAEQVAGASGQVSASSQSLAEGSSEQAAAIQETSSSLEEIASMTKHNTGNAQEANGLMNEANQLVASGQDSMGRLSSAIEHIKKSSDETAKIVKTIDEIAFQTNMLALNAAVEAARAGDAGKGFAVVAEEVRNLAQRSAEAARNTAELIEESVNNSERGVGVAEETSKALAAITESTGKVAQLVSQIASASEEQTIGIEQVNSAVAQMDSITQQNAANAEESASASEELNAQAEQLKVVVGDLHVLVGGSGDAGRAMTPGRVERVPGMHYPAPAPAHHGLHALTTKLAHKKDKPAAAPDHMAAAHAQSVPAEKIIPFEDDRELANF